MRAAGKIQAGQRRSISGEEQVADGTFGEQTVHGRLLMGVGSFHRSRSHTHSLSPAQLPRNPDELLAIFGQRSKFILMSEYGESSLNRESIVTE
jgi:hypothetical protein